MTKDKDGIEREDAMPARRLVRFPKISFEQTFAALKYRNFRLWFIGQLASLMGTWMQVTAQGFLIYQLTQSTAYLGYVAFAAGIPSWLFMLYGGVISDRMSRRNLMVITQTSMMILAFILAALTFANVVQPWEIVVLAFLLGIANAFDAPARQAFTLEMVSREDLSNAIALNSAMFNSATAIGPAVAGVVYALFGPGWCFTINGISFIAVIVALLMMRLQPVSYPARRQASLSDLRNGLKYTAGHSIIRSLMIILGVSTLLGVSFATLMPEWAVNILGGGSATNGLLQSARGLGSLIGALSIAALGRFRFRGKLLTAGTFAFPVLLMVFAFIRSIPLSFLDLVLIGLSSMIVINMCNTLVQATVADDLRGRVMGVYSLVFFGIMPLGGLIFGYMADIIGSPNTILLSSSLLLGFAALAWLVMPKIRTLE